MPDLYFKRNVRLWELNKRGKLIDEALSKVFDRLGLTTDSILTEEARLQGTPPELVDAGQTIGG
jgi:hypothetical protein